MYEKLLDVGSTNCFHYLVKFFVMMKVSHCVVPVI